MLFPSVQHIQCKFYVVVIYDAARRHAVHWFHLPDNKKSSSLHPVKISLFKNQALEHLLNLMHLLELKLKEHSLMCTVKAKYVGIAEHSRPLLWLGIITESLWNNITIYRENDTTMKLSA